MYVYGLIISKALNHMRHVTAFVSQELNHCCQNLTSIFSPLHPGCAAHWDSLLCGRGDSEAIKHGNS